MTQFIASDVEDLYDSRSSDIVTLLVGTDGALDELHEQIVELDDDVHDHVGRTTIKAGVPESTVTDICELPSVISVELDNRNGTQHYPTPLDATLLPTITTFNPLD